VEEQTPSWGPPWRHDRRTGRFSTPDAWASRRRRAAGPGASIFSGICHLGGADSLTLFHPTFWVYTLLLVGPFALFWRRRFPIVAFAVAAAASLGVAALAEPRWTYAVAPAIALFSLAKAGRPWAAWIGAGLAFAAWLLLTGIIAHRPDLRAAILLAVALVVLILLGGAAKVRTEHVAEMMKARAERARAHTEQERRQASEERLRIASELHDVLGHHLSLISVQAGVGLHLMDSRPEQAREALTAIKAASAEALREVRAMLTVLRTDNEAAPRQPALGLSRLDDLTADAGLPVTTKVTGDERPLPAEVDRAAYRIVQEALTNVRKHAASGVTVTIKIDYLPTALHLAIRNDGPAAPGTDGTGGGEPGDGTGIAGMRQRAQSLGGTVETGPVAGGFLVAVLLPTPDENHEFDPEETA
jgi:signal transduction histidine kinase